MQTATHAAMAAGTPVTSADALRGGKTISRKAVVDLLAPESQDVQVTKLEQFTTMLRASSDDDVKETFRAANKDERAKGLTIAPIVQDLMNDRGMSLESAANRVSEAKALWNAFRKGYQIDPTHGWNQTVREAREYLSKVKEETTEKRGFTEVGSKFAEMVKANPKADPRQLLQAAEKVAEEEAAAQKLNTKLQRASNTAKEVGMALISTSAEPNENAAYLVQLYGVEYCATLADAITMEIQRIADERKQHEAAIKDQAAGVKAAIANERDEHKVTAIPAMEHKETETQ